MKELRTIAFVFLAMCTLSALLSAGDHGVLKPCGDGKGGTCFKPVSYPVYYYLEPAGPWAWGFGPQWDDGDGIPESVIVFPRASGTHSWDRVDPDGQSETHYIDAEMPFLWCDARYFTDFYAWGAATATWGFNLALLDIVNDLTQIWTLDRFKDLRGCWVGKGHYQEHIVYPRPGQWNWEAQVFGLARDSNGKEFNVKMRLKLQEPLGAPIPDGMNLELIEFRSAPVRR